MLFIKELKRICLSLPYLLFLGLLLFSWRENFYGLTAKEISSSDQTEYSGFSTVMGGSILKKPHKGAENYGSKKEEIPERIMCGGTDLLIMEYQKNSYATYPFKYYKEVILSQEEQKEILAIIREITGLTEEQLQQLPDNYFPYVNGNIIHLSYNAVQADGGNYSFDAEAPAADNGDGDHTKHFISQVSYERFKELMAEVQAIVGKGSLYSMENLLEYYGFSEMTYDEAMEEYNKTIYDDRVSAAFARLFCDYMSRLLGLYPVFIAAAFWLKDRHSRINELIGGRQIATAKFVSVRFSAMLAAVMAPPVFLSLESLIPLLKYSADSGISIDPLAFIKYILWWLLPTAMIVLALGTLLTILTSSPLAVLVQFIWWFIDSSATALSGDTSLHTLMIRHNTLNGAEIIGQDWEILWLNRCLMVFLSILMIYLTIVIYNKKRGGKLHCDRLMQKCSRIFKTGFSARLQKQPAADPDLSNADPLHPRHF